MISNKKIVILGGGIGGAAAALALQKQGIEAHIYEQAPALGEVGAAIVVASPTQEFLYDWGAGDLVEKNGTAIEAIEVLTAQGQLIKSMTYKEYVGEVEVGEVGDAGRPQRLIHRARILDMLLEQIPKENIHLDHKYEELIEHEDDVEIRFENGEVVRADVVIAADGINSKARKMFSDDEPIFAGGHAVRLLLDRSLSAELSTENRMRIYQNGEMPILVGTVNDQIAIDLKVASEDPSWSLIVDKEEFMSYVDGFDKNIVDLLDKVDYPVISRGLYHRKPIERWSTKKVTLLGDAAHAMLPTLGQGANSAIQDAGVLALAFKECDSVEEALQRYEEIRRPITTAIQVGSADMDLLVDSK